MMRSDTLNWHDYGGYTEMTAPSSNVYSTDEDESKRIIVHETLLQNCSTDESESKGIIEHENLSKSCSTNEGKSKRSIFNETLLQSFSTNKGESKRRITNETLSHNCSADKDKLSSTEEEKPECATKKKRRK